MSEVIFESKYIKIYHHHGNSDYTLFQFGSASNLDRDENYVGRTLVEKNDISNVTIMAKFRHWYPRAAFEGAFEEIDRLPLKNTRVATGSSMGAYAAIKFSKDVGADVVLAFSPQWSIRPDDSPFDGKYIAFYDPELHSDMKVSSEDVERSKINVFADSWQYDDWMHASLLENASKESGSSFNKVDVRFLGHGTNHAFASSQSFLELIAASLSDEAYSSPLINRIASREKKKAPQYYLGLASRVARSRPKLASSLRIRGLEAQRSGEGAKFSKCSILLDLGRPKAATDFLDTIEAGVSDKSQHSFLRHRVSIALKENDRAVFHGMSSLMDAHNPMNSNFRIKVAEFLNRAGLQDEAKTLLKDGIRLKPGVGENYVKLAQFLLAEKNREVAESVLREGMASASYPLQCRNLLASILVSQKKTDEAFVFQEETLRLFPYSSSGNRYMAEICLSLGKNSDASGYAIAATDLGAPTADKYYYAAFMSSKADRNDLALSYAMKAVFFASKPKESFLSLLYDLQLKDKKSDDLLRTIGIWMKNWPASKMLLGKIDSTRL